MKSKDKGLTLISLVITIILLIILAVTSVNLIFGNKGIIHKAFSAKEETKIASIQEKLELIKGSAYTKKGGNINIDEYFTQLEKEKIEPDIVTNKSKVSDSVAIVEVNQKYSFIIEFENDIDIKYEGKIEEIDRSDPEISIAITGEVIQDTLPIKLLATISSNDKPINNAKWILNKDSEPIGVEEDTYTENLINTNNISIEIDNTDSYYLHVLTKGKYGIKKETVKGPIEVSQGLHKHVDGNNEVQDESYHASSSGGCFTKENIVYGRKEQTSNCPGPMTCGIRNDLGSPAYCYWCTRCGFFCGMTPTTVCPGKITTYVDYDTGERYYTTECGKTTDTFEGYIVSY